MAQIIDDFASFASGLLPNFIQYPIQEIADDINDVTLGRKVSRNLFRLTASLSAMVCAGLVPAVIAPNSIGAYLNNLFNALFSIEDTALLSLFSAIICASTAGTITLMGSKQLYRFYNYRLYGHTNSDYNFPDKRITQIVKRYSAQYNDVHPKLLAERIKSDINLILDGITSQRIVEKETSANGKRYKKNQKLPSLLTPQEPMTKDDFKLMLHLYVQGNDEAFQDHLALYSKIQQLYIQHYGQAAVNMYALANFIKAKFPEIHSEAELNANLEQVRQFSRRENIMPDLPKKHKLRPVLNILGSSERSLSHISPAEEKDKPASPDRDCGPLVEIDIETGHQRPDQKNPAVPPLLHMAPFVSERRRPSLKCANPDIINTIIGEVAENVNMAQELYTALHIALPKTTEKIEEAEKKIEDRHKPLSLRDL